MTNGQTDYQVTLWDWTCQQKSNCNKTWYTAHQPKIQSLNHDKQRPTGTFHKMPARSMSRCSLRDCKGSLLTVIELIAAELAAMERYSWHFRQKIKEKGERRTRRKYEEYTDQQATWRRHPRQTRSWGRQVLWWTTRNIDSKGKHRDKPPSIYDDNNRLKK